MILKGGPAGDVGYWSNYLLDEKAHERSELKEIKGLAAGDLPSALQEMAAIASGSRSHGNFMYQLSINPRTDERLTEGQWKQAIDIAEKDLGLAGHQRVVVEHTEHGRTHRHVIWNRVDVETGKVVDVGGNYRIHETTSRELEARFGLTPTPTPEKTQDRKSSPEIWELRAAERSGLDRKAMTAELTDLWHRTDTGQAFAAAVHDRGYVLAKGDDRVFCVIDPAGDVHSLARRLEGVNTREVRARMADVDREALPTVAEGRSMQRAIGLEQAPLGPAAAEVRLAWRLSDSPEQFVSSPDRHGLTLARVDANEAAASVRANAFAKEIGNVSLRYTEGEIVVVNSFGSVTRLDERTTGQTRTEIDKALGSIDHKALLNVTDARAVMKEAARLEFYEQRQSAREITPTEQRIADIHRDAATPGAFGATLFREGITIARVDGPGIEGLARDQRAAFLDDKLFTAPTLAEGELMAVNRFGRVERLNPTKLDLNAIEVALSAGEKTLPTLGDTREMIARDRSADQAARDAKNSEFWAGVRERKDARVEAATEKWEAKADRERARLDEVHNGDPVRTALVAVDASSKVIGRLVDIVGIILGNGGPAIQPDFNGTPAQRIVAERRANAAWESIRDDVAAGKGLKIEDIHNLNPSQLENIRLRGDAFVQSMISSMERNRPREYDYGRTVER